MTTLRMTQFPGEHEVALRVYSNFPAHGFFESRFPEVLQFADASERGVSVRLCRQGAHFHSTVSLPTRLADEYDASNDEVSRQHEVALRVYYIPIFLHKDFVKADFPTCYSSPTHRNALRSVSVRLRWQRAHFHSIVSLPTRTTDGYDTPDGQVSR